MIRPELLRALGGRPPDLLPDGAVRHDRGHEERRVLRPDIAQGAVEGREQEARQGCTMIMTAVDTANPVLLPSVGARNHEGPL